jgi:dipeptidyl aminopeptidase/acylaminoacyl peptidase
VGDHAKTNRFKAAQADRMISNWWSWYGSSDAQGLTEFEFYGTPWENPIMYDTLSPIRYLPKVKTPTLIVQSEEDHRTPMTDAEQWFLGLKKHGVPAELMRYPRSTHDLSRTASRGCWWTGWADAAVVCVLAAGCEAGGSGAGAGGDEQQSLRLREET